MDAKDEDEDMNDRATSLELEEPYYRGNKMSPMAKDTDSNALMLTNMDQFMEIMNNEQVEDVIDLNEKFLANALGGIDVNELSLLSKLELRVDTSCHSL